ncbi:MAG: hypothetical protein FJY67_01490 [Calditrichaeota bacterium]|nr:hypothetical protein [Calditrichota bacterium]
MKKHIATLIAIGLVAGLADYTFACGGKKMEKASASGTAVAAVPGPEAKVMVKAPEAVPAAETKVAKGGSACCPADGAAKVEKSAVADAHCGTDCPPEACDAHKAKGATEVKVAPKVEPSKKTS